MDRLDLGILQAVGVEPFAGSVPGARPWRPEPLARRLKASPRLVKDRLARLEREALAHLEVFPNATLLGHSLRSYAFDVAKRRGRKAVVEEVAAIEGVTGIVDYLSNWFVVGLAYADEEERLHRLAEVGKVLGSDPVTWFEPTLPKVQRPPTSLDWRILRALRGDARASAADLAARLSVSAKTVQRRLDQLAAEGAFSTFAVLRPEAMGGMLMCSLLLRLEPARARAVLQELHGTLLADSWAHCSAPVLQDGWHYDLVASPRSASELAHMLEQVAALPGVLEVQGHLATSVTWTSWTDKALDRRIASHGRLADRARASAPRAS